MTDKQLAQLKRRVKDRKASFREVDLLVEALDDWRAKALNFKFLLDRIWADDPILRDDTTPNLDTQGAAT